MQNDDVSRLALSVTKKNFVDSAKEICSEALIMGSTDNVTVMIIDLRQVNFYRWNVIFHLDYKKFNLLHFLSCNYAIWYFFMPMTLKLKKNFLFFHYTHFLIFYQNLHFLHVVFLFLSYLLIFVFFYVLWKYVRNS